MNWLALAIIGLLGAAGSGEYVGQSVPPTPEPYSVPPPSAPPTPIELGPSIPYPRGYRDLPHSRLPPEREEPETEGYVRGDPAAPSERSAPQDAIVAKIDRDAEWRPMELACGFSTLTEEGALVSVIYEHGGVFRLQVRDARYRAYPARFVVRAGVDARSTSAIYATGLQDKGLPGFVVPISRDALDTGRFVVTTDTDGDGWVEPILTLNVPGLDMIASRARSECR